MGCKLKLNRLVGSILILSCWPMAMAQSDSQLEIRSLVSELEKRIAVCPRREVVAQFDEKHHKQVWQKQGWGPPTDVFGDAKTNDDRSVLYPYVLVIEFSVKHTFGPERQTRADAAKDSELSDAEGVPAWLLTGRYRNTYLAGKDGTRLKKTEFLDKKLDGSASEWKERASWPDACWDQVVIKQ